MAESISQLVVQLKDLQKVQEPYMRAIVLALVGEVRQRIHVKGLKANGEPIGTYSNGYLKVRSGDFSSSEKFKKGKKKGLIKNAGVTKKGVVRQNYNRGSDPKVILSLTRQMEQDFVPIAEGNEYGLGFNNEHNFDKATWNEERYNGVYALSEHEIELATLALEEYLNGVLE